MRLASSKIARVVFLSLMLVTVTSWAKLENTELGSKRINERQDRQDQRIDNGIRKGSLTKWEEKRLDQQQNYIERREKEMRADGGGLSNNEKEKLEVLQDKASQKIARMKHDKDHKLPKKGTAKRSSRRLERQANRIAQGTKSGSLTAEEAAQLAADQKLIEDFRKDALADGKLSASDKRTLEEMQKIASKKIRRLKHNDKELESGSGVS